MPEPLLHARLATSDDIPALRALMAAAIGELQKPFLSPAQITSSHAIMGLDRQLIADQTYFVAVAASGPANDIVGCGGWSRRATLYGGDQMAGRLATLLDPRGDAARIRAMYTHPHQVRRGVGRLILARCEEAARGEGFRSVELVATLAGLPLYLACGYVAGEPMQDERGGVAVPLVGMRKVLG